MMGIETAIGVGASLVGSAMSADASGDAASDAAESSAASNKYATDVQKQMYDQTRLDQKQVYDQTRTDQEPWRRTGNASLNRLSHLMGLNTRSDSINRTNSLASSAPQETRASILERLTPQFTTTTTTANSPSSGTSVQAPNFIDETGNAFYSPFYESLLGGSASIGGASGGSTNSSTVDYNALNAAADAEYARQKAESTAKLSANNYDNYDDYGAQTLHQWANSVGYDLPENGVDFTAQEQANIRAGGYDKYLSDLKASSRADFGSLTKPFSLADYQADPGYAFRINEGYKGLNRSAAAAGGLQSGAALKAATRYGQEMGSQEYGNAYNRFNANQTTQYNRLSNLAGMGQTANQANQSAGQSYANNSAGQNYANQVGNYAMTNGANQGNAALSAGDARASGYSGIGNSLSRINFGSFSGGGNQGLSGVQAGSSGGNGSVQGNSDYYWDL